MPLFDVKCKNCGLIKEDVLLYGNELVVCPNCSNGAEGVIEIMERLIGRPTAVFHGSDFFVNEHTKMNDPKWPKAEFIRQRDHQKNKNAKPYKRIPLT